MDVKELSGILFYIDCTFEWLGVDLERIDCLPKESKIVTKIYGIIQ
jgi:hypothetical protein